MVANTALYFLENSSTVTISTKIPSANIKN